MRGLVEQAARWFSSPSPGGLHLLPAACLWLAVASAYGAAAAGPDGEQQAATSRPAGPSAEQRQQIAALKRQASAGDLDKAVEAIGQMEGMGPAGAGEARGLVADLLARNRTAMESAAKQVGGGLRLERPLRTLEELRKEALKNIGELGKEGDSLRLAMAYYQKLQAAYPPVARIFEARDRIVEAHLARRRLLPIHVRLSPMSEAVLKADQKAEAELARSAGKALGANLLEITSAEDIVKEPALADLAAFRLNRRTEAWNKRFGAQMLHPEEARVAQMVNAYRELLGLAQVEIDPRLIQSARRHSREMVEKRYFGHESPTEGLKTFSDRMQAVGYGEGGGENIHNGSTTGDRVFWNWFSSPDHHRVMVTDRFTAVGVGRWNAVWTANFGAGPRLTDATDEARQAARPPGEALPPQK